MRRNAPAGEAEGSFRDQLHDSLQIDETSLTHCESHFTVQQYES